MLSSSRFSWPARAALVALLIWLPTIPIGTSAFSAVVSPAAVNLRVLLIGFGASDPTTAAWQASLSSEGVPYTLATASGALGSETVTLPALSSGGIGNFNGVVIADSPDFLAPGQLSALDTYESTYGVRQVDGYMFPDPALGLTEVAGGALDNTTAQLTTTGISTFPELKGPIPIDSGTFGYTATPVAGAPLTPLIEDASGKVLGGIYQHPGSDPQAGVTELSLTFDYNATQLQWLLLAPGLINWVTNDTHLGLYRNYFGQDIDDNFIADNEWSSQYQCTPAATDPPDYTCPPGVANNPADSPPDVQMSATDVAYVVAWEQKTGITLNLAFNGVGACSAPSAQTESNANCTGSATINGTTYTDPGQEIDPSNPNDAGLINALLADQSHFNWVTHTWSHQFLGCNVWAPQALTSVAANASGGHFTAGTYSYEITAATAFGESEPSLPKTAPLSATGSATLVWPDATNGTSTDGSIAGPSLSEEEASHTGGSGFWGYYIYRENPGTSAYGLIAQVAENPAGGQATYEFTDNGSTAPGQAPGSGSAFPTATNPGIDCASGSGSWEPATSGSADLSIEQEIGLDDAFAAANGLTNFTPSAVVTGEHSGVENPNMPAALAGVGITTFASDASRQPQVYSLGAATSAPRYPSNIYYNASNWPDEINEYDTLYTASGVNLNNPAYPSETGHCTDTSVTTCTTTLPTEATILSSESHIMLSHVLANNPRVGYAHQANLIGPATITVNGQTEDYGYTILDLIDNMLSQYQSWYSAPIVQMTDVTESRALAEQAAWATALSTNQVSAADANGTVTVTNNGGTAVQVPITVPMGTTVNGSTFGDAYGGQLSQWSALAPDGTVTLAEHVAPTLTSASSASSIVGAPFSFLITTTGEPSPTLTESGALPVGVTFTDNGNGTATIAGTPQRGTGASYPLTITASNATGSATQAFTLTNAEAPTVTSANTASFNVGVAGSYQVTTTGYPAPSITESGALPSGLTFTDKGDGTGTIAGTPAAGTAGSYPVTLSATNSSGSRSTLSLTLTVSATSAPVITSANTAFFTLNSAGAVAITTTGSPAPTITETGALPAGLSLVDNGNGTALLSGTPTATGTTAITINAENSAGTATQAFSIIVGQAPSFTSPDTTTMTAGQSGSFTVTTNGYPTPSLGESGSLPPGVAFTDVGDGTATISGTPSVGDSGTYPLSLTATNGTGSTNQAFSIQVATTGTVSGSVTAAGTGNPLANICVYLYQPGNSASATYASCTLTDGSYVIGGVVAGSYDVAFADPTGTYATQWFNGTGSGATTQGGATPVTVSGGQTTSVGAAMATVG